MDEKSLRLCDINRGRLFVAAGVSEGKGEADEGGARAAEAGGGVAAAARGRFGRGWAGWKGQGGAVGGVTGTGPVWAGFGILRGRFSNSDTQTQPS